MALKRMRTCVACGATNNKSQLVRIVRGADGTVTLDESGRAPGRGAYVCQSRSCLEAAHRSHALDRALKVRVDEASWARLEQQFDMLCAEHSDVRKG